MDVWIVEVFDNIDSTTFTLGVGIDEETARREAEKNAFKELYWQTLSIEGDSRECVYAIDGTDTYNVYNVYLMGS